MRIWDVPCSMLSDKHLLGEHVELHTIYSAHMRGLTGGYSRHPETLRWSGHLAALYARHDEQVQEMVARGFNHRSPLPAPPEDSDEWPSVTLTGSIPLEAR
jgi:hypothetical protein